MTKNALPATSRYFAFLLRGWRGTDERGETVWRFTLVSATDGKVYRLRNTRELLCFLDVETAVPAEAPEHPQLEGGCDGN